MNRLAITIFCIALVTSSFGEGTENVVIGRTSHKVKNPIVNFGTGNTVDFTGATVTGITGTGVGTVTQFNFTDTTGITGAVSDATSTPTLWLSISESGVTDLITDLASKQPVDADLTAIAALTGTDTLYYRSATNTWTPVTIGGNMTFVDGVLNSACEGGTGLFSQVMSITPTSSSTGLTTWVNQGSSTVTDNATGVTVFGVNTGSDSLHCRIKTVPSTPYTIRALIAVTNTAPSNYFGAGIGWYDGTNKLQVSAIEIIGGVAYFQSGQGWSTPTSYGEGHASIFGVSLPVWLQITDDGTNVSFGYSQDGSFYANLFTVDKASGYLGSSGYSNLIFYCKTTDSDVGATLLSWTQL